MNKEDRQKLLNEKFYSPGPLLQISAGGVRRVVCLKDFDGFATIFFHRSKRGRVFCAKTYDEEKPCQHCARGAKRNAQAAIPVYNFTDKIQQVATFGGPKRGPLHDLAVMFGAMGTHLGMLDILREGEGFDTKYYFTPVSGEVNLPGDIVAPTPPEILKIVEKALTEEVDTEW
jgi:hypothetical protein